MSDVTVTEPRVEYTKDELAVNAALYAQNRALVDALTKSGDNAEDHISHVSEAVDRLRKLASTKAQFGDIKRMFSALVKSGWEGSTTQDIERTNDCVVGLEDQFERGKGLSVGTELGNTTATGLAAIILGRVASDAKIRDAFAQMGKM